MQKVSAWLFLLIALMWLLPLIGVNQLGMIGSWVSVVALVIVGIMELKG
jgi:hypothetical protein